MRVARFLAICGLFVSDACTRSLDEAPCPCTGGYVCCKAVGICYPPRRACEGDGQGGSSDNAGTDGGRSAAAGHGGDADEPGGAAEPSGGAPPAGGASSGDAGTPAGGAGSPSGGGGATSGQGAVTTPSFALVATQHNDSARTGANTAETTLTPGNVREASFGELSRRPVRGAVFAQPLVAPAVKLEGGDVKDVLYVATMANMVYAL